MAITVAAQITITKDFARFTERGFGVPLLASYHTRTGNLVDTYSSLSEMTDDGFATTDHAYKMASAVFSQSRVVERLKIGRLETAHTHTVKWTPVTTTEGFVYDVRVRIGAVDATLTYTVQAADTVADIVDGLAAAHAANTALAAVTSVTDNTTDLDINVDTAGNVMEITTTLNPNDFELQDITTDAGLAADLTAIAGADEDFYALVLDVCSDATVAAASAWVDSNGGNSAAFPKIGLYESLDAEIFDSGVTTDIASDLAASSTDRNGVVIGEGVSTQSHAALAGEMLPRDPGSATWAYQRLIGPVPANLNLTQINNAIAKNATVLAQFGSTGSTSLNGTVGSGEYFDVTRGLDWVKARAEAELGALLVASPKVPFTETGIAVIQGVLLKVVQAAVTQGVFSPGNPEDPANDPIPTVLVPTVGQTTAADRASRILRDVVIRGRLAGAIHTVIAEIKVSV